MTLDSRWRQTVCAWTWERVQYYKSLKFALVFRSGCAHEPLHCLQGTEFEIQEAQAYCSKNIFRCAAPSVCQPNTMTHSKNLKKSIIPIFPKYKQTEAIKLSVFIKLLENCKHKIFSISLFINFIHNLF